MPLTSDKHTNHMDNVHTIPTLKEYALRALELGMTHKKYKKNYWQCAPSTKVDNYPHVRIRDCSCKIPTCAHFNPNFQPQENIL